MAFCGRCGAEVGEGIKFCPECGEQVIGQTAEKGPIEEETKTKGTTNKAEDVFEKINNTKDSTGDFDSKDIQENKVMAILAYIGILWLVPMLAAPKSKFAQYHANQGLILFITYVAYAIARGIVSGIFYAIYWGLGNIISFVLGLGWLALACIDILGIINAAQGKAKELPVIGKYKILK